MTEFTDFDNKKNYGVQICTSSTKPTAYEGRVIYETDTNNIMKYTGAAWVNIISGGGTKKVFFTWLRLVSSVLAADGDFAVATFPASTIANARGNIYIPPDFSSGAKIYAIVKPSGTGTGYMELAIDYGAIGQSPTTHAASGGGTIAMSNGIIMKSAEISLASAAVGDFVGVRLLSSTSYSIAYNLIGFILEYES